MGEANSRCGACTSYNQSHCIIRNIKVSMYQKACIDYTKKMVRRREKASKIAMNKSLEEWSELSKAKLIRLNTEGHSILFISQQLGYGCDECLAALNKLGVKRYKVSALNHAKEMAEEEERRQKAKEEMLVMLRGKKAEKKKEAGKPNKQKEDEPWPEALRTVAYSQRPCKGQCCARKKVCQHYESWLEHGKTDTLCRAGIASVEDCINGTPLYRFFTAMPGTTEDDLESWAETL